MYCGDEVGAIIGDVGSSMCKFGYAGEDLPKAVFPSDIGAIQPAEGGGSCKYVVGSPALNFRRDNMEVRNPMTEGLPTDWDVIEQLWTHGFEKVLRVDPKEHPLLLAEPSFNTQANREKQAELAFETLGVQALFIAKNSMLSAFSVGRSSALVVDIGHSASSVAPVYDGHSLRNSTIRSNIGGQMLNEYMSGLLHKEHSLEVQPRFSFSRKHDREGNLKVTPLSFPLTHPSYEIYRRLEIVADVKESCCVMPEMTLNEQLASKMPKVS
jgi:actin-like protein 6A